MEIVTAAGGCRSPVLPEAAAFYVLINNVNIFIIFFWGKKKNPRLYRLLSLQFFPFSTFEKCPIKLPFLQSSQASFALRKFSKITANGTEMASGSFLTAQSQIPGSSATFPIQTYSAPIP